MGRKKLWLTGLLSFIVFISNFQMVFAHEGVTAGDYEIEIGWINEPSIVGQHIANSSSGGIFVMNLDGSTLTWLISAEGGIAGTVNWIP